MGVPIFGPLMLKLFGSRNQRMVKRYLRLVDQINAREEETRRLTDAELRARTAQFRDAIASGRKPQEILAEVFAVAREAMDRGVGIRSIFNPALAFDPTRLSAQDRGLYEQTRAEMEAAPARAPEGDLQGCERPVAGWEYIDIPVRLYDAVRELLPQSRPPFRARPFDVQLIGGMVLSEGRIAEMKTGEGKTIVGPLACYYAVLQGMQVHVVTVNDYLVQRDRDWTFPFFRAVGLTVGAIHPFHMQPPDRKKVAYGCDVVYGTTSEFGFDYLRDNMKLRVAEQVQRKRDFAIVDEVDSILIDEARTPLIISGPAHSQRPRYELADQLARHLVAQQAPWNEADEKVQGCRMTISGIEGDIRNARDRTRLPELKARLAEAREELPRLEAARDRFIQYYEVELDKKKAMLTHEGIAEAQRKAGLGSFYVGENIDLPHLLEQSIRAHIVYQRDRDYVVATDDDGQQGVIIVDQNTGRKMIGRQWSDGLHQAVESKEGVRIKDETQTMATITIQNFFKLYRRLAGMTGTADTEATEFHEIYRLDVVSIPTNVPVVRTDRNDLVFLSLKDKWDAILEEIKGFHDAGRPILVGTTSVEKSELLSRMLTQRHAIRHEVLNAKQHDREAEIVAGAGQLGAVMIATNMAGRGTDIKLGSCSPAALIEHWKRRGIAPKEVEPGMSAEEIVAATYRHTAGKELGLGRAELERMSDADVRLALLRHWAVRHAMADPRKAEAAGEAALVDALDGVGFLMHRLRLFSNVEEMGGLHIIGTERHESRRIDNQLRGRSGRQGDNGSSRFFLSLEDDLMKMFAGKTTLNVLSRMGMKEGDAIESTMLSNAVAKAQRKVEERNFQIRKNILEYDEPMEHQRRSFYGTRQRVLEGRDVKSLIFEYIDEAVRDAAATFLDPLHRGRCIAEWAREHLGLAIEPARFRNKDREDTREILLRDAREEATQQVRVTLGEYIFDGAAPEDWDVAGLAAWAKANFGATLDPDRLRRSDPDQIQRELETAAERHIDSVNLGPVDRFLAPLLGETELANWANTKFGPETGSADAFRADMFSDAESPEEAARRLVEKARAVYARREIEYPVDFAIEMTSAVLPQNPQAALTQFCSWVNARYELEWRPEALPSGDPRELRRLLIEAAARWDAAKIAERAKRAAAFASGDPAQLDAWFQQNCLLRLTDEERQEAASDCEGFAARRIAELLRSELSQFEQWVLLQILDTAWKDHLHAMDASRDSIGFRAFSQRDPRIEFKKEASRLFGEMQESVRDKVTDIAFRGRLMPQAPPAARPPVAAAGAGAPAGAAAAGATAGAPAGPTLDVEAERAGREAAARANRPAPAAAAVAAAAEYMKAAPRGAGSGSKSGSGASTAAATADRGAATGGDSRPPVGRNEPCPCGSGKKFKHCHGAR
ncbi:MAG TPA: preprotein translocase subunit SecA [Phycisphaerales bacterium]|nr:preprotein translocase subunit SecA [Phycisphaerales bacterium]HMP37008.1 preprotein translocase subunit SecA [Phycisphaerales bacterium]